VIKNPATLTRRLTLRQLRLWLALLFLLLAAPIIALVWHAYGQLKWEAFHQSRALAEELSDRINANFSDYLQQAESRSFSDYSYLVVTGDISTPFLQSSPLSQIPVVEDIPGTIGYFQIDTDGQFTTPAMPNSDTPPQSVGIGSVDLQQRQLLSAKLLEILSENQLVSDLSDRKDALIDDVQAEGVELEKLSKSENSVPSVVSEQINTGQAAFDKLRNLGSSLRSESIESNSDRAARSENEESTTAPESSVSDLGLDLRYEARDREKQSGDTTANARLSRKEQNYIPESVPNKQSQALAETAAELDVQKDVAADAASDDVVNSAPAVKSLGSQRITAFESDIDPMEFSLLDSGHFVAYRTVWREKQRLIQGVLIDRELLTDRLISEPFRQARVSSISALSIIYQNNVLNTFHRNDQIRSRRSDTGLQGTLLYRNRMADPLNALELVFSIRQLPPGPGARVLAWVTAILAAVFLGGFYLLYRAGREQIALINQQQDFVSAVSHELKTPLTSIRLYGELLKQGWASEEKKQQYYSFIHDESERLSRLIENVLKLANINRNELVLDLQPIAVTKLMATIQDTLHQQAENSGFDVQFKIDPSVEAMVVVVDRDSVMQIMVNLLDNAIKFSKHAQRKDIEVLIFEPRAGKVAVSVRDYGPGIPKDQLANIFRMFYRSENELTRETVGTGIGLAIVQQLCVAMHADIDVMNRDPGAEFLVNLPVE